MKFNKIFFSKIKNELIKPDETTLNKAISIGFGSFMAFTPIWGFQMIASIPFIFLFRLNKVLVLIFVNASIAPLLPIIIYGSFKVGGYFVATNQVDLLDWKAYSLETIQENILQYMIGSIIIALCIGAISFCISFLLLKVFRNKSM